MKSISAMSLVIAALALAACSSDPKFYSTFFLPKNQPAPAVQVASMADCVVYFDVDSATVRADQTPSIDRCAHYLSAHPQEQVALGGYADERGSASHNQKLSERRAQAVKDLLYQRGISGDHISIASFGEEHVAVASEEAWSHSRRVEIHPSESAQK